jgi:hypothetical protein
MCVCVFRKRKVADFKTKGVGTATARTGRSFRSKRDTHDKAAAHYRNPATRAPSMHVNDFMLLEIMEAKRSAK